MKSCEQFQAQLLEHLYGLLEAEESLALIEHAGQCDLCRGALLRADSQRQLLSAAAVTEFPAVTFQEPEAVPALRPARTKAPAASRRPRVWRRWAAAAAVVLGVAGLAIPATRYALEYQESRAGVESSFAELKNVLAEERKFEDARASEILHAEKERDFARTRLADLEDRQGKAFDDLAKSQLYMVVTGQQAVRPGVPTEYHIETRNLKNEPEAVKLKVRVLDVASGKTIKEEEVQSEGSHTVALETDASLKAGSQLRLEVVATNDTGAQRGEIKENLTLARAVYITHLATDRPMYRPGDTVRFRSLTLDRFSLRPPTEDFRLIYSLHAQVNGKDEQLPLFDESGKEIAQLDANHNKLSQLVREPRVVLKDDDEKGAPRPGVQTPAGKAPPSLRGIGAGAFILPPGMAGGEYTLQVRELENKFPVERRKFIVHNYQAPTLNKQLKTFDKSSYGPGDEVLAYLKVAKVDGGTPLVGQPVLATIRIDGKSYNAAGEEVKGEEAGVIETRTDGLGEARVRFKLPARIERGDAVLAVQFTDGAAYEALSKPIPVAIHKLNLEFFPEGGYLIAGVPNRVYFQARTLLDKPAEVKGHLVDAAGKTVAVFGDLEGKKPLAGIETLNDKTPGVNQGMGEFFFTPQTDGRYRLVLDTPEKIEGEFWLPAVETKGVTLTVPTGVTDDTQPLDVVVNSVGRERELLVGAYCRGVLLDQKSVKAKAGEATRVALTPGNSMGGVFRVTVFEKQPANANEAFKAVAERLVYREPAHKMKISITGKTKNAPGDKVTLTLKTMTEAGQPLPTVLLVGVVDKSLLNMADERTARSLPTHFLLTSEVRRPEDLEFADVLLTDHVQAKKALDLLLGTQGWRRFAESSPEEFQKHHPKNEDMRAQAAVERLMVSSGLFGAPGEKAEQRINTVELEKERLLARFKPQFEDLEGQLGKTELALEDARNSPKIDETKEALGKKAEAARAAYVASLDRLQEFEEETEALRKRALLAFGLVLLVAGSVSFGFGLFHQARRALPVYAAAMGAVGLSGMFVLGTYLFETQTPGPVPVALAGKADGNDALPEAAGDPKGAEAAPQQKAGEGHHWRFPGFVPPGGGAGVEADRPADGKEQPQKPETKVPADNGPQKAAPFPPPVVAAPVVPPRPGELKKGVKGDDRNKEAGFATNGPKRENEELNKQAQQNGLQQYRMDQAMFGRARNAQYEALERAEAYKRLEEQVRRAAGANAPLPEMRDQLNEAKMNKDAAARELRQNTLLAATPTVVRVYAHQNSKEKDKEKRKQDWSARNDFTETLYWHPALVLPNGEARIDFDLNDGERTFEVMVAGHTNEGVLGATTTEIESQRPFSLEASVPRQVTSADTIDLPVFVRNNTSEARDVRLSLELHGLQHAGGSEAGRTRSIRVPANDRKRVVFSVQPTIKQGPATVVIRGSAEPFGNDSIAYEMQVLPEGFPARGSRSDLLEKQHAEHDVKLPKEWVKQTLKCEVNLYPSRLADLQQGLSALLREPNGCFEQTSSSNYPNLLVLDYLEKSNDADPAVRARAREMLARGYAKLVSFECGKAGQRQGYDWFGGEAPPHEALSAYGLLEFTDMERVGHPVDKDMMARTRKFLLDQRDGKGGFKRNSKAIDTFGRASDPTTNAYIVWALTETDPNAKDELKTELQALIEGSSTSRDTYYLALAANSLLNCKMFAEAAPVLQKLAAAQKKPEGLVSGAETSITCSGEHDRTIETTALAVLAWVKVPRPHEYERALGDAVKWITQQRSGQGGFGATQSTILALKALLAHTAGKAAQIDPGEIALLVNGKRVATVGLVRGQKDALTLEVPNAEEVFKAGQENKVEITSTSKTDLPYTLSWSYQALTPENAAAPPVRLSTTLDRNSAKDGETVNLKIALENTTAQDQGMVMAIIGLPAGLTLPEDFAQLNDYTRPRDNGKEPARIAKWETRDRELILYFRGIKAKDTTSLELTLNCRVPGLYRGSASRAYPYYDAQQKHWSEPIRMEMKAKAE